MKSHKAAITLLVVAAMCLFGFIGTVIGSIKQQSSMKLLPAGRLYDAPRDEHCDFAAYPSLDMCIRCAGTDYVAYLPSDSDIKEDMVRASLEGVDIYLGVSEQDADAFFKEKFAQDLYFSVLGYKPDISIASMQSGYLGRNLASFVCGTFDVKISVRKATYYAMCYGIKTESGNTIYVGVSCDDGRKIAYAADLLANIALSVCKYNHLDDAIKKAMLSPFASDKTEVVVEEVQDLKAEEPKAEEPKAKDIYDIDLAYELREPVADGYFVAMWENYMDNPSELHLFDGDREYPFVEDESVSGFFVFRLADAPIGLLHLVGYSDVTLRDVYMEVYDKDTYEAIFED